MDYSNLTEVERHELNIAWLPRLTVPNVDGYIEGGARRSAEVRERLNCHLDIAYGDSPRQVLDVFPAAAPGAPVFFFIHGGYWRAFDKGQYSEVVEPVVAAGATAVTPSYDLCPNVSIPTIVDQVRKALIWTYDNVAEHNGDPTRIHVCGHSAGGHLTGMMMATDWQALRGLPKGLLRGAIPISGVFDIEPHMHTDLQGDLKLTAADVAANSPLNLPLHFDAPVICAVGGAESGDFRNQSKDFVDKCKKHDLDCEYFELDGDNHFDAVERLADADHPLTRAVLAQMGLS
jgi:arylformamidase